MTRKSAPETMRCIEDGDLEQGFPCFVGHGGHVDPCERPAAVLVYGLSFCEVHGAEVRDGALEEMHQHATEWFGRFDPEGTDDLLVAAFPFRKDKVWAETVAGIIDPPRGEDPPYDWLHYHRYELHQLMRHAYRLGLTFVVERIEEEREAISS